MQFRTLGQITKEYKSKQWCSHDLLEELSVEFADKDLKIGDLGCGKGDWYDKLKILFPKVDYYGIDIATSNESKSRTRKDINFTEYDGVNIPFENDYFDIIWSNQVFEHVRFIDALLKDVHRVLKPDGKFAGSLSGIEPYHSNSIFNLTPWGWLNVLNENKFDVNTMRPGIDGIALIKRYYSSFLKKQFVTKNISELNQEILNLEINDTQKNRLMLNCTGHILFISSSIKS